MPPASDTALSDISTPSAGSGGEARESGYVKDTSIAPAEGTEAQSEEKRLDPFRSESIQPPSSSTAAGPFNRQPQSPGSTYPPGFGHNPLDAFLQASDRLNPVLARLREQILRSNTRVKGTSRENSPPPAPGRLEQERLDAFQRYQQELDDAGANVGVSTGRRGRPALRTPVKPKGDLEEEDGRLRLTINTSTSLSGLSSTEESPLASVDHIQSSLALHSLRPTESQLSDTTNTKLETEAHRFEPDDCSRTGLGHGSYGDDLTGDDSGSEMAKETAVNNAELSAQSSSSSSTDSAMGFKGLPSRRSSPLSLSFRQNLDWSGRRQSVFSASSSTTQSSAMSENDERVKVRAPKRRKRRDPGENPVSHSSAHNVIPLFLDSNRSLSAYVRFMALRVALVRCSTIVSVNPAKALRIAQYEAMPLARSLGHVPLEGRCWYWVGRAEVGLRNWFGAVKAFEKSLKLGIEWCILKPKGMGKDARTWLEFAKWQLRNGEVSGDYGRVRDLKGELETFLKEREFEKKSELPQRLKSPPSGSGGVSLQAELDFSQSSTETPTKELAAMFDPPPGDFVNMEDSDSQSLTLESFVDAVSTHGFQTGSLEQFFPEENAPLSESREPAPVSPFQVYTERPSPRPKKDKVEKEPIPQPKYLTRLNSIQIRKLVDVRKAAGPEKRLTKTQLRNLRITPEEMLKKG